MFFVSRMKKNSNVKAGNKFISLEADNATQHSFYWILPGRQSMANSLVVEKVGKGSQDACRVACPAKPATAFLRDPWKKGFNQNLDHADNTKSPKDFLWGILFIH
jgi:hypothetical protein